MMFSDFWSHQRILVTGGAGFLGSYVVSLLKRMGVEEDQIVVPRKSEFDLRDRMVCRNLVFDKTLIIHIAGHVGGIAYNQEHQAEIFYDNLIMGTELMEAARRASVQKFVTIGTTCSYPKNPPIPFREDDLWNGYPDEVTGPYGLAKKMLLVQGQVYHHQYGFPNVYLIPTNLYGPGDRSTHVIPQLIQKFLNAEVHPPSTVTIWGTGNATRDFLFVEDAAEAILLAAERCDDPTPINLGSGQEISIRELVETLSELMDFKGTIHWDMIQPEGHPRRFLDIQRAQNKLGFLPKISLKEGLQRTVEWARHCAL